MSTRTNISLNGDWKFILEDVPDAARSAFDDAAWRTVQVPHDWSVEHSFDQTLEGATGYLPGGIGWYRKSFTAPGTARTHLLFDGVYNNATVYLNGEKLGDHPYGYSPFYYDISDKLVEGANQLAVRVDRSRYCDSRWYTGSGIYRDVSLVGTGETSIPMWGSFVTTPEVTPARATVQVAAERVGDSSVKARVSILDPSGAEVASEEASVDPSISATLDVANPQRWDIDSPHLYTAVISLLKDGEIVDQQKTRFGIRAFEFDAEKGFFLNGRRVPIQGVCLHHDGGCVGAAVPKDVWRRRFEKLRAGGVNAIRIAHNPGSKAFLDLCDEMGFLVQDEFFDEWDHPKDKRKNMNEQHDDYISRGYTEHFQAWAERDLKAVMRAHRNHPSIIQWSIGNEIEWTYPRNAEATGFFDASWDGNYFWSPPPHSTNEIKRLLNELPRGEYDIGETAQRLARWTREMDTTRPVIANCILPSSSYESGYAEALDIMGYSYRRVMYDYGHEQYPNLPIMGTENLAQWHEWKAIEERPFVAGTFLWTGIDYMGESNEQWPSKSTESGLLDAAGFEKGSFHMMKTLWNEEPHVHLATQTLDKSPYVFDAATGFIGEEDADAWQRKLWVWHEVNAHWNYEAGELIAVEVYSNQEEVELFLDGASLGKKALADFPDRIYKWAVPFKPGKLEARAAAASDAMVTASEASAIALSVDGCHVIAQLVDDAGVAVQTDDREIVFKVDGARILGVDTGAPTNVQDYQSDRLITSRGRCLLVLDGAAKVTAESAGLASATVDVAATK